MAQNRYLVTPTGAFVGSRVPAALTLAVPLVLAMVLCGGGVVVGGLGYQGLGVLLGLLGLLVMVVGVTLLWVILLRGSASARRAAEAWLVGDYATAIAAAQAPLRLAFRADVRTKALHVLGLCAEARSDFEEAADLFARSYAMVPAMAPAPRRRHVHVLALSHQAIALVAMGRLDEADHAVRTASAMYPRMNDRTFFDAINEDSAFGSVGMASTLASVEPGRDPRGLLGLSSALVLAARGWPREAFELLQREEGWLQRTLLPRERALVARVEELAHGAMTAGGPMRSASPPSAALSGPDAAWVDRVLPRRV